MKTRNVIVLTLVLVFVTVLIFMFVVVSPLVKTLGDHYVIRKEQISVIESVPRERAREYLLPAPSPVYPDLQPYDSREKLSPRFFEE